MKTIDQLPDIARQFNAMSELTAHVDENTLLGFAIKKALVEKAPYKEIAKLVKDNLRDNRKAVLRCIPADVVKLIEDNF